MSRGTGTAVRGRGSISARVGACAVAMVAGTFAYAAPSASAAGFVVDSTADSGSGSLRDAIEAADDETANPGKDTITFDLAAASKITLTSGELKIDSDVDITGPGADKLTVSGAKKGRVFEVASGAKVSITGLTVTDGLDQGADEADGSGIPGGDASGGGVLNAGTLTLEGVAVSANQATGGAGGSGCDGCQIIGNPGAGGSGGVGGTAEGGGILNTGTLTLRASLVSDNQATAGPGGDGGDGVNQPPTTFGAGGPGGNGGSGAGGGIESRGTLTVENSTVSGNSAAGAAAGKGGKGPFTDGLDGIGGSSIGGGLLDGTATLTAATIASNTAGQGANVEVFTGTASLESTIVADPKGGGGNCAAQSRLVIIDSKGHNLEDANTCHLDQASDQPSTDPKLGTLQPNGGPTATRALPQDSLAVDKGTSAGLTTDQRGEPRPSDFPAIDNSGDGADVGAFELQAPSGASADLSIDKSDSPDPVTVGGDLTYTLTVKNNGGSDATGVKATDALPAGVTFKSQGTSANCTNSSGTVTCDFADVADGATESAQIVVTADQAGELSNTASVAGNEDDPTSANDADTETTTVQKPSHGPERVDVLSGKKRGGTDDLARDDDSYFEVTSRDADGVVWVARFSDVPQDATSLTVTDRALSSRQCDQRLAVFDFKTERYVELARGSLGADEDDTTADVADLRGNVADYIGGHGATGPVKVKVTCTRTGGHAFTQRTDLLSVSYDRG